MIRKALVGDATDIVPLVNHYASRELMLPRSLADVYSHLRDFFVWEEEGGLLGCAALHISWDELAEIRSLAVKEEARGKGIGADLVSECLREARELGVKRVFVLTYECDFFGRLVFRPHEKEQLPHKIWSDCLNCPKFTDCDEEAMIVDI